MIADLNYEAEGDPNEPLTRGEFNEAMQLVAGAFERVATKEDLKQFATKDDLQQLRQQLVEDKKEMIQRMADDKEEILRQLAATAEIITDQSAGAHRDDISSIKEKQERHEERIGTVEERLRISPVQ